MPPAESHKKPFTKEELSLLKRWIEAGAPYEDFWAFKPVVQPDPPKVGD